MAAGWVHASMDLMAFGRSYFDLHKYKDHPWKELGYEHRQVNHNWYNEFEKSWNFDKPFPPIIDMRTRAFETDEQGEKYQSWISHDYLDRVWDTLDFERRRNFEQACKWFLENPEELNRVYEIDVFRGLIFRVVNGKEVTENCPELVGEYRRLRAYVDKVKIE